MTTSLGGSERQSVLPCTGLGHDMTRELTTLNRNGFSFGPISIINPIKRPVDNQLQGFSLCWENAAKLFTGVRLRKMARSFPIVSVTASSVHMDNCLRMIK